MNGLGSLTRAMTSGFLRDRATVFFTIFFPLFILLLLGSLFRGAGPEPSVVLQVGDTPILDRLTPQSRSGLARVIDLRRVDDRAAALQQVRQDNADAAIEQRGDELMVHFSAADQVQSGTVLGVLRAIVQEANLQAAGIDTPRFTFAANQVEDESLQPIQFLTPGLLGWAIATGATFGAALTLVSWRQKKLLRRLRLAPVSVSAVVGARVGISLVVALVQTALFIGVALLPYFGLQLATGGCRSRW